MAQAIPSSSRHRLNFARVRSVLLGIILLALIMHLVIYLAFGAALIPFPYDYDQAEGFELNNAILLSQGACPYCSNNTFPFFASGYPPLFHFLMVPFVWFFGGAFWYGRLIIFASTLITALLIGYAVWRSEQHRALAIAAGLAFLSSNYIYHIGPLLRQHLLMVMFETLAVILAATAFGASKKPDRLRLALAFFALLCAGYTKQLAISTCAAVAIWVFLRNPRSAILYSFGLILAAGLVFAGWMVFTNGDWWLNIITSNQNPYITDQFTGLLGQFLRLHWPLLVLSGLLFAYELYFDRLSIFSIWWIVSLISTTGAGKWGAGDSYFATTLAASCILAGQFAARSWRGGWKMPLRISDQISRVTVLLVSSLLLIYALTVQKLPTSGPVFGPVASILGVEPLPGHRYPLYDAAGWVVGYAVTGHFPSADDYTNGDRILERVQATSGYVMSEDAGFSILAGREVVTNPVQLYNLYELGLYDPGELIAMLDHHEIGLVILRARFLPPPVLEAIERNYYVDDIIPMNGFTYELWVPQT